MFTRRRVIPAVGLALCLATSAVAAEGPNLGKPFDAADIAAWDISIAPDGTGLPPGAGTSAQGAGIYAEKCAQCHGPDGKGGVAGVTASPLVGSEPITDISARDEDDRQFLAIRDNAVRLHPAGDAVAAADGHSPTTRCMR